MLLTCAGNKHTLFNDGHFSSYVTKLSELKVRGTVL